MGEAKVSPTTRVGSIAGVDNYKEVQMSAFHPRAMASLIATIVTDPEASDYERQVERRIEQVTELAVQYYKVHPVDYNWTTEFQVHRRNSLNNRALLSRANLR